MQFEIDEKGLECNIFLFQAECIRKYKRNKQSEREPGTKQSSTTASAANVHNNSSPQRRQ